jgi:hypothetical protein
MSDHESVPLGQPIYRWSDMNDESEYWDYYVAAPDDQETLVQMWWGLGAVSLAAAVFVLTVMSSILLSPKARASSFNMYLVYLMVPDFFFSASCVFICWLSATAGHFRSSALCHYESFYVVFGIGGNAWVNVLIIKELHVSKMLVWKFAISLHETSGHASLLTLVTTASVHCRKCCVQETFGKGIVHPHGQGFDWKRLWYIYGSVLLV